MSNLKFVFKFQWRNVVKKGSAIAFSCPINSHALRLHHHQKCPQQRPEDFGNYNIILTEESSFRRVPIQALQAIPRSHIKRRYYASVPPIEELRKKIKLEGEEGTKLRNATMLARNVREFAGTLVKV